MKLRADQLNAALRKGLLPIYLVSGDEPLQVSEALDAIRRAAAAAGYGSRELFYAETGFDWSRLAEAGNSFSLFADKRILDLRLPAKPDKDAAVALQRYAERLPEDAVLIVSLPRLSGTEQKARWFQVVEPKAAFVQVWPLEGPQLIEWLDKRMAAKGMLADRSGLEILAARVEGNLLAAAQEVEKLHILYGGGRIEDDKIRKAVADSARYDVYDLAEAAMLGQSSRAARVLSGLRAEGVAAAVALWSLARDLRLLIRLKDMTSRGEALDSAFYKLKEKVFDKRKTSLTRAAHRLGKADAHQALLACARADRVIKGIEKGDPWDSLLEVCLSLAGKQPSAVRH